MLSAPPDDPWQEFARDLLQDAVAQRGLSTRQLSELLMEQGLEVAPKTLARRINRGAFDAGFFMMCLTALGTVKIDIQAERVADVTLQTPRTWTRARSKV